MIRRKLLWLALILLVLSLALPALAQSGITVISQSADYRFSRELTFELTVESSNEIGLEDLLLFYTIGIDGDRNRRIPEYEPGTRVEAQHVEELQRGEIPPGSEIEYFWRIQDAAGNSLKTESVTFTYMDDRFEWHSLSEGMIRVYWYGANEAFGQEMLRQALDALERLERNYGVEPEQPVKMFVYRNRSDMREALVFRGETAEESHIQIAGTVVAPDIVLVLGTSDLDVVIPHELTHVVVHLLTDNPYSDLPRWLDEGLAMYNEGRLPGSYRELLERAIRENRLHSVRSLASRTGDPDQSLLWYGEVYSVVEYLLEAYGRDKMAELLEVFSEGADYDDALIRVYGFDQTDLDAQWRAWLGAPPREKAPPDISETSPEMQAPSEQSAQQREPTPEKAPAGGICGSLIGALSIAMLGLWRARTRNGKGAF